MIVHPELQALRGDDAPQRQAQGRLKAVHDEWLGSRLGRGAAMEVERFDGGSPVEDLPLLSALFAPDDPSADAFVTDLVGRFLACLAAEPIGQVPLRCSIDDATAMIILLRHGTTALVLQAVDGQALARRGAPQSLAFVPAETYERVLAGKGAATRVRIAERRPETAVLEFSDQPLVPGIVAHRTGKREAAILRDVSGSLVTLKLQRRDGPGGVTSEYRLDDGQLLHQAAGTPRDSRLEMAVTLLGRMGRSDAAPLLAAMAEEVANQSTRWEALRECLGLDTALGFAALCRISRREGDPLAAPAGALRAQLLETYPQLAGACPCPA